MANWQLLLKSYFEGCKLDPVLHWGNKTENLSSSFFNDIQNGLELMNQNRNVTFDWIVE